MEDDMTDDELRLWVLETLQHIQEVRADFIDHNTFSYEEQVAIDKKLTNIKTLLDKLLIPIMPSEDEIKAILRIVIVEFTTISMTMVCKTLMEYKKRNKLVGDYHGEKDNMDC